MVKVSVLSFLTVSNSVKNDKTDTHIPKDEIVKIEHYPHGINSHRIVGEGMFFGNLGLFTCSKCGRHLSLVTDPIDVCIIIRKSKMPIVVSIKDNSVFNAIAEVQEKN